MTEAMKLAAARVIVNRISTDIADRSGIGDEFNSIDEVVMTEMLETWTSIVVDELA